MSHKRGRPPLDDSVRRHKTFILRLREGEQEELKTKAAEAKVSVASYIRSKIFGKERECL